MDHSSERGVTIRDEHAPTDEQLQALRDVREIEPPMAVMVSAADRDWIDAMRVRSIELARQRYHLRH